MVRPCTPPYRARSHYLSSMPRARHALISSRPRRQYVFFCVFSRSSPSVGSYDDTKDLLYLINIPIQGCLVEVLSHVGIDAERPPQALPALHNIAAWTTRVVSAAYAHACLPWAMLARAKNCVCSSFGVAWAFGGAERDLMECRCSTATSQKVTATTLLTRASLPQVQSAGRPTHTP